jgi:hypothetical protein
MVELGDGQPAAYLVRFFSAFRLLSFDYKNGHEIAGDALTIWGN